MLTDKFLEESGDDVSNDFTTLETLLLIWMGLRLRNLSSLEDIEEEYPKWKNKACREFFEYSGTEFQKVKKSSQSKVKTAIKNGIAMTVSNIFSRLKDTDSQTSKKDMMNRSNKNLNKGIKDTQGEIKNLCNISRKCTNKQFIKACDEAYSKIVAGNNADKAIESSIRKLSQKGIEVVGYTDHTTSMDAAVKRAVTSGVNQTSLKFKMENCKEFDKNRNDDQYVLEQKQRYYERQIRSWKKRKNILDECGVDSTKEAKKIREWQDKRSQFIKESNIQFKKEHGIDNVLKKAYPREKVVKRPFFGEDSNGKIRKKINSAEYDGAPKIFDYSKEKEEKIIETLAKVDKAFLKDGYEHMAISNRKTGGIMGSLSTSGNNAHVDPSEEMYKLMSESAENSLTMVHNHPLKTPPSVGDIITCNNNKAIGEMLVINSDGETYFFSIPKDARINLSTEDAQQELRAYFNAKRNWIATQYPDASENDIRHLTLKRISEEAGWNYGRKRTEKK